jgi:peptide-methionine (S)-S-oxide reductase
MFSNTTKTLMPTAAQALPGRAEAIQVNNLHAVKQVPLKPPFPEGLQQIIVGLGCFWGAERKFWQQPGVYTTAVGYAAGFTPNPTYEEVCSGLTGHNEVVLVVFDPSVTSLEKLLKVFWEAHNPTQGMRQGNDRGTQYRSGIYYYNEAQKDLAEKTQQAYQEALEQNGIGTITTEILSAPAFYYAETYTAPALPYLLHPCSRYGGGGWEGVALH